MMTRWLITLLFLVPFCLNAQSDTDKRLALIIGNADYQNANKLLNPVNDARSMKDALTKLGFDVMEYENLTQREMKQVIDEFGRRLENYGVGLFYFAGHGIQANGNNYLIPIETNLTNEQQIEYDCVRADRVLGLMEYARSKVNIVILDACRNNPFQRSWSRSANSDGLAFMNAPSGSLIAYATAPGKTASDGAGSNGLYTEALLKNVFTPDLTILQVFQNVRRLVVDQSGQQQIPWESTSLIGDFFFNKTQAGDQEQKITPKLTAKTESGKEVGVNTSHLNSRAVWKSDEKEWHLLDNQKQIASRTIFSYVDDDLLAYDPTTGVNYLLKGYAKLTDNVFRPADIISEVDDYLWRSKDLSFYVYDKGKSISQDITYSKSDDDMLVYHPATTTTLVLDNYYKLQDNKLRPARLVSKTENIFWKSKDNMFLFFVKGDQVATATSFSYSNDDLLVYYDKTGATYLLKNFGNLQDNQLRPALLLSDQHSVYWSGFDNKYHLYVKGKDIATETTSSWSGNDLEVVHTASQTTYLLKNFATLQDRQLRTASVVESSNRVQWKAENNLFYVQENNVDIQLETVYAMAGNDLIVYHPKTTKTYLLENYSHLQDNQWRPARLLSTSSTSVFWMAENNVYWLYVQGKQIAQETTNEADGNHLLVRHTSSGSRYRLTDFYSHQDKKIRAATVLEFHTTTTDDEAYKSKGNATWRGKDGYFWLYVNEEQIAARTTSCYSENDLIVFDPVASKTYLLEDYKNNQDDQLRTVTILNAPDNAVWRANDAGYYIYEKGVWISSATDVQSHWAGNDLVVFHTPSNKSYRLENYNSRKDDQLRPAYLIK